LLTTFKQQIHNLKLVPSGGGAFEVSVGKELIYSKLKTGKFPEEQAILDTVGARLKKASA
jgi:selenoprotein W-related protein